MLAALVASSLGLPSHHHGDARDDGAELTQERHDHGVIIAELLLRVPSIDVGIALPAPVLQVLATPVQVVPEVRAVEFTLPYERPPPTVSPRAPPVPVLT